jgi:HlyD family secretion protein
MLKNKLAFFAVTAVVLIAVFVAFLYQFRDSDDPGVNAAPTFTVEPGPLTINVVEAGTIKAREQIIIKNEVEGKTSIIFLIDEGKQVTKGELLVELDASSLMDQRLDQEIKVQNAEAAYVKATEDLAVAENQAKSDIDLAELTLEFARQDLEKYIKGEYPNELKKTDAQITLAQEELTRAADTLSWSETLHGEKYISQTELAADHLAEKKKALDLELAQNNRDLLVNYTYGRELAQRKSDVSQAVMALERTRRKARAGVVQAGAELKARNADHLRQKDKFAKYQEQIELTKIYAPADGLVIYATSAQGGMFRRNSEPLQEGQDIRERQELIYLPTANSSNAEIAIHESSLKKVRPGQDVKVTVDALPGRSFTGRVLSIAPLPDAQSLWMNPDLKVYTTEIFIDQSDPAIRTGMGCQVEIVIEHHDKALYVPVQAVLKVAGKSTVYVKRGSKFLPTTVETGLDNNRMIHLIKGVEPGDAVLLTPPLKAAGVDAKSGTAR